MIIETHNFVKKGSISFADVLKIVQQKILNQQAEGFVTLQKASDASVQNSARENPVQLAQNIKKVSLEGFNPLTIEKNADGESGEGKVLNDVDHSLKAPLKDLPTGQSSTIEPKTAEQSKNEPEQNATTKVQKLHSKAQHFVPNPDILNATASKQNELVQNSNEFTRIQSTDQNGQAQRFAQSQNASNVTSLKQTNKGERILQISEFARAQDVHRTAQQAGLNQDVLNKESLIQTQKNEQAASKSEEQNRRETIVETAQKNLTNINVKPSHGVPNFKLQNQESQNVARYENLTQSQGAQISQAAQSMLSQENLSNVSSSMQVHFNRSPLKNNVETQQRFESKQLQFLKKETTHEELKPILSKVQNLEADATEAELVSPSRQKIALVAQQTEIKIKDVKNNEADVKSKHVSMSQVASQPAIVLSATQVRLIVDNLSRYIKEVSSETTQFKHLKREMPETIKVREPIKIETFKLTVAKEIKQVEPEPLHQKTEKLETTEQLKEAMNSKLAKRTYEQEQPPVQHVKMEQRNVDQIVVRVEQEQRSQNLQTIVETIKQMRETFTERAEIQLSPPSLGKLEIELVKQQDSLTIFMRVSTQEAKQMIENSSKELVSRLSSLGFKVEQVEVRMNPKFEQEQTNEERENNQQSAQHEQQQRKQKEDDEDDKRG
ncbi:flagellar hook-length control protein FliK [Pseudothermotoga sp.]